MLVNIERVARNNKLGGWLMAIFGMATPIFASALEMAGKIDSVKHPTISSIFSLIKDWSLYIYIIFLAIFIIGKLLSRKGDRVIWETLQKQVDTLQSIAFPDNHQELNDNHRVTLFKFKRWCWNRRCVSLNVKPWSGWLVPVLRSGHTGKDTKALFRAPDSGRHAEGIVGACWSSDAAIHRHNLPRINNVSSQFNKEKYCRLSNMPPSMLESYCKDDRPVARSILAYPVKTSTGNRWGVMVFDSMNVSGVDTINAQLAFQVVAEPLGVLVEGV